MLTRFILSLFILQCFYASSAFSLSGDVSGTWTLADSPVLINGDIRIPTGSTLIISPGVTVSFDARHTFTVNGKLQAIGSSQKKIVFTRTNPTEASKWGGIEFLSANNTSVLEYCIIEYAKGDGGSPAVRGGAVYIDNCSPTIRNCLIQLNYTHNSDKNGAGGAIYLHDNSSSLIENNHLTDNETDSGGAIYIGGNSSWPTIKNNLIENNLAHSSGGGIYVATQAKSFIFNNTIRGNTANYWGGGGITLWNNYCHTSPCTDVYNNVIYGNNATNGGGIYCRYNVSNQFNNTITQNSASQKGGGIYVLNQGNFTPTITNSIVWNNNAPTDSQISLEAVTSSAAEVTYSNVQGSWNGTGNLNSQPLFANSITGDFRLLPQSPGIDAGNNNLSTMPDFDFAGNNRIIEGDNTVPAKVDTGASEFDPNTPVPADINGNSSIDLVDTILILQLIAGIDIGLTGDISDTDINQDGNVGLAEAIYSIQHISTQP